MRSFHRHSLSTECVPGTTGTTGIRAMWVVLTPVNSRARGRDRHVHEYTKTPVKNAQKGRGLFSTQRQSPPPRTRGGFTEEGATDPGLEG